VPLIRNPLVASFGLYCVTTVVMPHGIDHLLISLMRSEKSMIRVSGERVAEMEISMTRTEYS